MVSLTPEERHVLTKALEREIHTLIKKVQGTSVMPAEENQSEG